MHPPRPPTTTDDARDLPAAGGVDAPGPGGATSPGLERVDTNTAPEPGGVPQAAWSPFPRGKEWCPRCRLWVTSRDQDHFCVEVIWSLQQAKRS